LPTITIGVDNYGWQATKWSHFLTPHSEFWDVLGSLLQTIYDGGTLKHREYAAWAAYYEAAAQYRATAINAFQNVADSLQAIQWDAQALHAADKAERAAAKSLGIACGQLEAGDVSMLILLTTEQTYLQARLNLVQAQANRLTDTVALFQALGGGWWNEGVPE
jgi:outer membrane protein TolC